MKPDFGKYSLALINDGKIVFSSDKEGIRPLVECVRDCSSKYKGKSCTLHDKVVGLAAARLIVFSGCIKEVFAGVCSKQAKLLLEKEGIAIDAGIIVEKILNKDKTGMCRMETKALEITDNKEFYIALSTMFSTC